MAKTKTVETIEDHHGDAHAEHDVNFFSPQTNMLVLTWIVFFLLLAVLKKFAFGPILKSLDQREDDIRKSIENADKLEKEMAEIDQKRQEIIGQAEDESKTIIDEGRKAAVEAGNHIKAKAKEESQILMENAQRQIHEEKDKAFSELKGTSAQIAVELASKLIEENIDEKKNKKLIDKIIDQMS